VQIASSLSSHTFCIVFSIARALHGATVPDKDAKCICMMIWMAGWGQPYGSINVVRFHA
jgi:hypothetical protein